MENTNEKKHHDPIGLKILLWFTVFMIVGGAVCIILGALQWAIHAAIVIGAILIVIGLLFIVTYQSLRHKIHQDRKQHELERQQREQLEAQQKKLDQSNS